MCKISWDGKVVFTANTLTKKQYMAYFDTNIITYSIASKTMEFYCGTVCALPVDCMNAIGRTEAINRVSYGDKWLGKKSYKDLPSFTSLILVKEDDKPIEYASLPYKIKRFIAEKIINDSQLQGQLTI